MPFYFHQRQWRNVSLLNTTPSIDQMIQPAFLSFQLVEHLIAPSKIFVTILHRMGDSTFQTTDYKRERVH